MKRFIFLLSCIFVLMLVISACTMGLTPPPAVELPQVQPPAAQEATLESAATEAPASVDLAGPPMEIGSRYTWFDGSVLVAVPGDTFLMGTKQFADSKEHEVSLSDYWIYSNEVTNQQFAICVEAGKCDRPDKEANPDFSDFRDVNLPVVGVNYEQAVAYCDFVHGRLPTEAEWEYAARGPEEFIFPWGDESPSCSLLNHDFCKGKLVNIGSYPDGKSDLGLWDMSGNVREWVADWYAPEYDLSETVATDPLGPALGEKRSVRSSSFQDGGDAAYAAHRFSLKPVDFLPDLGFRCVVENPTFYAPYCQSLVVYGGGLSGGGGPPAVAIPVPSNCGQAGDLPPVGHGQCADPNSYVSIPDPIPAGYTPNVPANCGSPVSGGGITTYTCTGSGSICLDAPSAGDCDFDPPPGVDPECLPGYTMDVDAEGNVTCTGQGPGANCPAGFELDPLLKCCTAVNPGPNQYGYCVGFDQVGSDCYYNPGDPYFPSDVCKSFAPNPPCENNCPGGNCGGDDGGQCPNSCRIGWIQCSDCSCVYATQGQCP
jgi:formylglycine-generating enzyme required for sulfatase activity